MATGTSGGAAQQISREEYERQAVEYTTQQVQQLNANVRQQPALGAKSTFFQSEKNIEQGIPVFQGKHTRFVYDDDEEEIVDAVDVTQEAISAGPYVRTVEDLDNDDEADEEEEGDDEDDEEAGDDDAVANQFYPEEEDESDGDADMQMAPDAEDFDMASLLEDVAMELASVALDEKMLMDSANAK
ncbi:hypothetical protein Gpo141_00009882 [Globisporangium polare]